MNRPQEQTLSGSRDLSTCSGGDEKSHMRHFGPHMALLLSVWLRDQILPATRLRTFPEDLTGLYTKPIL